MHAPGGGSPDPGRLLPVRQPDPAVDEGQCSAVRRELEAPGAPCHGLLPIPRVAWIQPAFPRPVALHSRIADRLCNGEAACACREGPVETPRSSGSSSPGRNATERATSPLRRPRVEPRPARRVGCPPGSGRSTCIRDSAPCAPAPTSPGRRSAPLENGLPRMVVDAVEAEMAVGVRQPEMERARQSGVRRAPPREIGRSGAACASLEVTQEVQGVGRSQRQLGDTHVSFRGGEAFRVPERLAQCAGASACEWLRKLL